MSDVKRQPDKGKDPFAELNKLLEENPEFKSTYDSILSIMSEDVNEDEEDEVECVEIEGQDYFTYKKITIAGTTYLCLVNENNVLDFLIHKVIVEDGEEYITELDSDEEYDLALAYFQRESLMMLKDKLKKNNKDSQDNQ